MAISIDWGQRVINIPHADLTLVGGSLHELDVDAFRLTLKNLEDGDEGIAFPATHRHNTQVTLSGVVYARVVEIINGYKIQFGPTPGGEPYIVRFVGANHNLGDVINYDGGMSAIIGNSAGLIVGGGAAAGLTVDQDARLARVEKFLRNKRVTDPATGTQKVYDDDGSTVLAEGDLFEDAAGTQPYRGQGAERSERLA